MNRTRRVTGPSRRIGKEIGGHLARAGVDIVVHFRRETAAAEAVVKEITALQRSACALQFDIADREACKSCIEADMEQHGAYYGVVCNAGIARDNAFPAISGEDWDLVLHTNLDGFYNVLKDRKSTRLN